jgi:hypothetical protein
LPVPDEPPAKKFGAFVSHAHTPRSSLPDTRTHMQTARRRDRRRDCALGGSKGEQSDSTTETAARAETPRQRTTSPATTVIKTISSSRCVTTTITTTTTTAAKVASLGITTAAAAAVAFVDDACGCTPVAVDDRQSVQGARVEVSREAQECDNRPPGGAAEARCNLLWHHSHTSISTGSCTCDCLRGDNSR